MTKAGIERVIDLVPGLDALLCGGFLRGGLYIIQGSSGAGKTILANQIIYNQVAEGSRALFVTVLGESHGRMMAHLRPDAVLRPIATSPNWLPISAPTRLSRRRGSRAFRASSAARSQPHGATLLVLGDGIEPIEAKGAPELEDRSGSPVQLQTLASATNCTMFLLTTVAGATSAPEHTMVDGLIECGNGSTASATSAAS